jgi:hypothetical protein
MSRKAVIGCAPLGVVDSGDAGSSGGAVAKSPGEQDAMYRLRVAAARIGANMVLLPETPAGGMTSDRPLLGEAYKCVPPE